jgi:hypothetical protein
MRNKKILPYRQLHSSRHNSSFVKLHDKNVKWHSLHGNNKNEKSAQVLAVELCWQCPLI